MTTNNSDSGFLATIAYLGAWLLTSIGAILDALYVREAILSVLLAFQVIKSEAFHKAGGLGVDFQTSYLVSTLDLTVIFVLGCVAVAAIIYIEYYFRKGRPLGLLGKRIARVIGIEVVVVVLAILIRIIFNQIG